MKAEKTSEKETQIKEKSRLRENIEAILVAILLALFIRTFVVQAFKIPSGSMKQTLQIGDHILVNKFVYGVKLPFLQKVVIPVKDPQRNDVIVFKFPKEPEKDFIKRVVAVAGDEIEIRNKKVYVNDQKIESSFAQFTDTYTAPKCPPGASRDAPCHRDNFGPVTVPKNKLFVMGDNRDHSYDSRFWDFVDLKVVSGKAFIIYWSWDKDNFGVRWGRIGRLLK